MENSSLLEFVKVHEWNTFDGTHSLLIPFFFGAFHRYATDFTFLREAPSLSNVNKGSETGGSVLQRLGSRTASRGQLCPSYQSWTPGHTKIFKLTTKTRNKCDFVWLCVCLKYTSYLLLSPTWKILLCGEMSDLEKCQI